MELCTTRLYERASGPRRQPRSSRVSAGVRHRGLTHAEAVCYMRRIGGGRGKDRPSTCPWRLERRFILVAPRDVGSLEKPIKTAISGTHHWQRRRVMRLDARERGLMAFVYADLHAGRKREIQTASLHCISVLRIRNRASGPSRKRRTMSSDHPFGAAPEPYLTAARLASILAVSPKTIGRWVNEGMPSETWGLRARRFQLSRVREWLTEREQRRRKPRA